MRAWTAALIVFVEHMARTTSDKQITTGGLMKDCSRTIMVFKKTCGVNDIMNFKYFSGPNKKKSRDLTVFKDFSRPFQDRMNNVDSSRQMHTSGSKELGRKPEENKLTACLCFVKVPINSSKPSSSYR